MAKFKVGDRVRVRTWESMAKEFGTNDNGSIKCAYTFPKSMRHLCGRTARVDCVLGGKVILADWSDCSGDIGWAYCSGMLELVERPYSSIHITTDETTATAKIEQGGRTYNAAVRLCDYKTPRAAMQAATDSAWNTVQAERAPCEPEKPTYYNGKVVCVDAGEAEGCATVGKVYTVERGKFSDDRGNVCPVHYSPIESLKDMNHKCGEHSGAKFIEFKGEAE